MASPVDSARQGTNISTAATSHAINVGSPVNGTLLIVMVRFAAAPGTVTFTGYTQFAVDTSDASDDDTRLYYRWADGTEGATDTLSTTNSVKLAAISWEVTGAANPATTPPSVSSVVIGTAANINPGAVPSGIDTGVTGSGGNVGVGDISGTERVAQSFVAGGSSITQVQMRLTRIGSPGDNFIVEVQTDSSGAPSGTAIGTVANVAASSISTTESVNTFSGLSIAVSPGVTYWLVARRSGAVTSSAIYWNLNSADVYANGSPRTYNGSTWGTGAVGTNDCRIALTFSAVSMDYLFLTVIGMDHETATATQPAGYSNLASANSGTGGAVATNCMIWGASKQATASSEDPAAWTSSAPTTGVTAWTIAIPAPAPKQTSVAEISLASHGTPSERTTHSIKVRARTTSGSTGVLKAALYEGSTNRSGDLTSSALTNSLADYTLAIPDASAANITDYSNLSIRLWGYDSAGNALVFEVANVYLELPAASGPATYYGATATAITFGKAVAGITSKKTTVAEISLASHGTPSERTNHKIKIRARTTSGSTGVIRAALYEGSTNRSGDLSSSGLTNSLAEYSLVIPDASAANITDYSNLSIRFWGFDSAGNALVFEVAQVSLELPAAGAATYYGVVDRPFTFVEVISASRKTFSVTATAFTFTKAVIGQRRTTSQIVVPFTFTKDVLGSRKTFSQIAAPFTFSRVVSGSRKTFSQIAAPFTFSRVVSGSRKTFSQIAVSFTFVKDVNGQRKAFGQIVVPFTFVKSVSGKLGTFGQIVSPFTFTKSVSAFKQTFGQVVRPFTFAKEVVGLKTALGQIVRPFTFVKDVAARRTTFGQVAQPFTFGKAVGGISIYINRISATFTFNRTVTGSRKTFSQIAAPFTFIKVVSGTKKTFGQIVAPFTFSRVVSGKLGAFSQIVAPFVFTKSVSASKQTFAQVVRPFTFVKDVTGRKTTFGQTTTAIVVTIATAGVRTVTQFYGTVSASFTFVKDVAGRRTALGQTISSFTFSRVVSGSRKTFSQIAVPFTFSRVVSGSRKTFGQIAVPFTFSRVVSGSRKTFSQIAASFTFTKAVSGVRTVLGQIVRPFTVIVSVSAFKQTYGQLVRPFTFVKDVAGRRGVLGQIVRPFVFTKAVSGQKTTFSRVDLPLIFTEQTSGRKQTFGRVDLPIHVEFYAIAEVQGVRFGKVSMDLVFDKSVSGTRKTFGQIDRPYLFARSIQAVRQTFSRIDLPITLSRQTSGRRTTFGNSTFPINVSIVIGGTTSTTAYGQVALSLVLGEQTSGLRKTFGRIAAPYTFDSELVGRLETFSAVDFPIDFIVDVNTGHVETFSSLGLEFLLNLETAGMVRPEYIILNLAKALYLGSTPVDAVYVDSQNVWSK